MNRVIQFTKIRFVMFAVSILLIIGGIAGTISNGGFNLGIDFQAGLSQRVQIAPSAFSISYTGSGDATVNVARGVISISVTEAGEVSGYDFPLEDYTTFKALASVIRDIDGFSVSMIASDLTTSDQIVGFSYPVEMTGSPVTVNYVENSSEPVKINDVREVLESLGHLQIQVMGDAVNQEFSIRVQDPGEDNNFSMNMAAEIFSLLSDEYGSENIIVKQTDYVGARFSGELGSAVFSMTLMALILILVYIWFRFQLAYAVSAIIALTHDVLIMIGFIGVFQMEVVTATIAAVLTIIGYSLNDTIVVFDRIRENNRLLKDASFKTIVNSSITQSLSRTVITSLTTLLAVVSLFIFGTGSIQDFALAMIVGVIVGTYSSIFIASPVLLGWVNLGRKRRYSSNSTADSSAKAAAKSESKDKADEKPANDVTVTEIPKAERKLKGKRKKK